MTSIDARRCWKGEVGLGRVRFFSIRVVDEKADTKSDTAEIDEGFGGFGRYFFIFQTWVLL